AQPAAAEGRTAPPEVRLPNPAETGARPPEPKPEPTGEKKKSSDDMTRDTAAEIIKQYTQRRPQI
ncbi:MAG: hypothetical protein KF861_23150, partial [Planctomycetaceae bacterium]|nr:hypothetical protein [Planctomycetaceae bacterium]